MIAKALPPIWEWVRHGDGWALMQDSVLDFGDGQGPQHVHGLNRLTVNDDGFDHQGDYIRARIVEALTADDAKHKAIHHERERVLAAFEFYVSIWQSGLCVAVSEIRDLIGKIRAGAL